jgi:hypothetical protein
MPLSDSGTWQVRSAVAWQDQVRAELDARLTAAGLPPGDYEGTVLGALAFVIAWLAWRVDQSVADALSALVLATAPGPVVRQLAADRGLVERPGIATIAEATAVGPSAPALPPLGSVWRIQIGTATIIDPATGAQTIITGETTWIRVEDAAIEATPGRMALACDRVGIVTISAQTLFAPADPIPGYTAAAHDQGLGMVLATGRPAETAAELRQRVAAARSAPSGTAPGIRAALLGLPEVLFAAVQEPAPGQIRVSVALLPNRPDAPALAAAEVYRRKAAGAETTGPDLVPIVDDDGAPRDVRLAIGGTQNINVIALVTPDGSVPIGELVAAVRASILDYGSTLGPGDPVRYARVYRAAVVPGVRGLALTVNGGTVDVTPTNPADFPALIAQAGVN